MYIDVTEKLAKEVNETKLVLSVMVVGKEQMS